MKKKYRILSWLMAGVMVCSAVQMPEHASAKKLTMANCGVFKVMPVGSTFQLQVNGKKTGVKYTSGKEKVVSVSDKGLLKAGKKGTAMLTVRRGSEKMRIKIQVKKPVGYTISKVSGTYEGSVKAKVKAKKGYQIFFTTGKKFQQKNVLRAGKSKTFTFRKTKTLKLYALSASARMTTVNLNKTEKFSQSRGDYLYRIVKKSSVPPTDVPAEIPATVQPAPVVSATPDIPAASATGPAATAQQPTATETQPAATASLQPSASASASETETPLPTDTPATEAPATEQPSDQPIVTIQPGQSGYQGDDTENFTAAEVGEYDSEDLDVSEDAAMQIVIPRTPEKKSIKDEQGNEVATLSKKNKLVITQPGTYMISTEQDTEEPVDGRIEIEDLTEKVHLILNGVNLTSTNNDAELNKKDEATDNGIILIKDSARVIITLRQGTTNKLTDIGTSLTDEQGEIGYPCGIYCKKTPLTLNGTGALSILSANGNGIKATNSLKILDASICVGTADSPAAHNGISGKLGFDCKDAKLSVYAVGDGMKTTLDASDVEGDASLAELGNMSIEGGDFTIVSKEGDAISVYRTLYLNPEKMDVTADHSAVEGSHKALKAGTTIYIPTDAGVIHADTSATYDASRSKGESNDPYADDTIHCDGSVCIDGGTLTLASGDDGIHADAGLLIRGGAIEITEAYEGLEAADITIKGGSVRINARDDGINAGGGNDGGSSEGDGFIKPGEAVSKRFQLIISGGEVDILAGGDGMDCNGNIFIQGGTVTVNSSEQDHDSALDYGEDALCEISGGTLIAAGAVGMDRMPTDGSSQSVVLVEFGGRQTGGTHVVIKDAEGKEILHAQPAKEFHSVVLSCEAMKAGETYTVSCGQSMDDLTEYCSVTFTSFCVLAGEDVRGLWEVYETGDSRSAERQGM